MRSMYVIALTLGVSGMGLAQNLPLDPGTGASIFSNNSNDGYSNGRGMWFEANNSIAVDGGGFFNGFFGNEAFTMTLWSANSDGSNLNIANLGSFVANPTAGTGYWNGTFGSTVNLVAGNFYALQVDSQSAFASNSFYNWNGPGVNLGDVTVLDGYQAGSLSNTVAPVLQLHVVPEPASMIALGAGLVALARRRRRN